MNYKKITLGFDETWVDVNVSDIDSVPSLKIKRWADTYMPHNYTIDWYSGEDHNIAIELIAKDVNEKMIPFALLSLPGMVVLETENYETHPAVEHLFDFGDKY